MKKNLIGVLTAFLALCLFAQVGALAAGDGARGSDATAKYGVFDKIKEDGTTSSPTSTPADIKKITLSRKKAVIFAGREGLTLIATVFPDAAAGQKVTWSSNKPDVATVADGVITPVKPGKATITCKAANGNAKATCAVTVKPVKVESLTVSPSSLTLKAGETADLVAAILPSDATNGTVLFKSGNSKIVTVDQTGLVTAVKPGKTAITVSVKGFGRKIKVPVAVDAADGGETGKLTAVISGVSQRRLDYSYTANGVVKSVKVQFAVQCSKAGKATLRKTSTQTGWTLGDFKKYDFDDTEEIELASGTNLLERTFYSSPWTYSGSDAPLRLSLTVAGKSGAQEPLTYRLNLYALKLTEWR